MKYGDNITMTSILERFLIIFILFFVEIYPQQEIILNVNSDGLQEVIPLGNNIKLENILQNFNQRNTSNKLLGVVDTLKYFSSYNEEYELNTNFGFYSHDVAFQWYAAPVELVIEELWWKNIDGQDSTSKIHIRSWYVDERIFDIPSNAVNETGRLGYYDSKCDSCAIKVTPYKLDSTSILHVMKDTDTTHLFFDPLKEEIETGDTIVNLHSSGWQKFKLSKNFYVHEMQQFGFTIENLEKLSGGNERIGIQSKSLNGFDSTKHFNPSHSMKFYSTEQNSDSTIGWQIKNYDWGMFVVASVVTDGPSLIFDFLNEENSFIRNKENKVAVKISNYGGLAQPTTITDVFLKYKLGYSSIFSPKAMSSEQDTFYADIPPYDGDGPISLYIVAKDIYGNRFHSTIHAYQVITSMEHEGTIVSGFSFTQNFPNPFNPTTSIQYALPYESSISITVYNTLGQIVKTFNEGAKASGSYSLNFNGEGLSSGVYLYSINAVSVDGKQNYRATKKMLLIK